MPNKKTPEQFLTDALAVHGDRYDYSRVVYVNSTTNILIDCPTHGWFKQTPDNHLHGKGCSKCGRLNMLKAQRKTNEQFIAEARGLYGDRYDYSRAEYVNNNTDVLIGCPIHGWFKQTPHNHLADHGCFECAHMIIDNARRKTNEQFVAEARGLYGDRYDYSRVVYVNNKTSIQIGCPIHGWFKQAPYNHLKGTEGCPLCKSWKGEKKISCFLRQHHIPYKHQWGQGRGGLPSRMRFDFAVNRSGEFWLIEHHGRQHYLPCDFGSKKDKAKYKMFIDAIKRDRIKLKWCKDRHKNILVIPYWEEDRIEEILDDFFAGKEPIISDMPEKAKKYEPMRQKILKQLEEDEAARTSKKASVSLPVFD